MVASPQLAHEPQQHGSAFWREIESVDRSKLITRQDGGLVISNAASIRRDFFPQHGGGLRHYLKHC
jgi:hypothetical protein